jgi:hypothetical protein
MSYCSTKFSSRHRMNVLRFFPSCKNVTFLTTHTNVLTFLWWAPHLTWQLEKPDRKGVSGGTAGRVRTDECCISHVSTHKSNFVILSFLN